jgi:hypothetical protein
MYTTLPEFKSSLDKMETLLVLTDAIKDFSAVPITDYDGDKNLVHLNELARENRLNFPVLNGTLLLYVVGQFESFVKLTFEELCTNISQKAERFSHLPKEMRENLIKYTAEVISNPRKYGHADLGVRAFVKTLSDNLSDEKYLETINSNCISITNENMRPQILKDLFKRVGIKNIWDKISEQAKLQLFFETHDSSVARKMAENLLNKIMDVRNGVAHPSSSFSWPDHEFIKNGIIFLGVLGEVLVESLSVIEFDLFSRIEASKTNKASQ